MEGAEVELLVDPVDKLGGSRVNRREGTVREGIAKVGLAAQREILIISPYFVPGDIGIQSIRQNRRSGVRMRLYTNSLAATDEPAVHAGYIAYRRELAELGVEVFELSPSLARHDTHLRRFAGNPTSLHMKAHFFDRTTFFVGSMNLDGRSEQYNTEVGLMIRSSTMAENLLSLLDFTSASYRVNIDLSGRMTWINPRSAPNPVLYTEPEVGILRQLSSEVLGLLLPDDWL